MCFVSDAQHAFIFAFIFSCVGVSCVGVGLAWCLGGKERVVGVEGGGEGFVWPSIIFSFQSPTHRRLSLSLLPITPCLSL